MLMRMLGLRDSENHTLSWLLRPKARININVDARSGSQTVGYTYNWTEDGSFLQSSSNPPPILLQPLLSDHPPTLPQPSHSPPPVVQSSSSSSPPLPVLLQSSSSPPILLQTSPNHPPSLSQSSSKLLPILLQASSNPPPSLVQPSSRDAHFGARNGQNNALNWLLRPQTRININVDAHFGPQRCSNSCLYHVLAGFWG